MEEYIKMLKLFMVLFFAIYTYIAANTINNHAVSKMDKYLPKKKWRSDDLFWFYKKGEPARWLAYWIERITQIIMLLFFVSLIMGNMLTKSWDFFTIEFVGFWVFILFFYPVIFIIGVDVYVFFRELNEKKCKR